MEAHMKIGAEAIEQIIVVEWLKQCTDLPFFHIAGERKCSPQYGAFLKRLGTKPGVSDLFFPRASKSFSGMFMELKTLKGKPTVEQISFLEEMKKEGYFGIICYGSKEAIETIKIFYGL